MLKAKLQPAFDVYFGFKTEGESEPSSIKTTREVFFEKLDEQGNPILDDLGKIETHKEEITIYESPYVFSSVQQGNKETIISKDFGQVVFDYDQITNSVNLTPADRAKLKRTLQELPNEVKFDMVKEGIKQIKVSDDPNYRANFAYSYGKSPSEAITISKSDISRPVVIVHELGHAIDELANSNYDINFWSSGNYNFQKELNEYKQNHSVYVESTYGSLSTIQNADVTSEGIYATESHGHEMFAECYVFTMLGETSDYGTGGAILQYFPDTYKAVLNQIDNVRNMPNQHIRSIYI